MTDDQVKELLEGIEDDVERFTDAIDSQYRTAVIRSASGEVAVEPYLKDLRENSQRMRERFDSDYSASNEVLTFLRQAHAIDARSAAGGGLFGAESEWPRLRGSLARLGEEYGIDLATDPARWQARRINDDELVGALRSMSDASDPFKNAVENATENLSSVSKAQRESILDSVDRLNDTTDDLREAVEDGADPSGHLALLTSTVDELQKFMTGTGLSSSLATAWAPLQRHLSLVRSAFKLPES
jgi:hypothetical protein